MSDINLHAEFLHKPAIPLCLFDEEPRTVNHRRQTTQSLRLHGGISLEINGMPDHVHLLAKLRPDEPVSNVLRDLKANASGWMHKVFPELNEFRWQDGYGAFTVSQSQVEQVSQYICRQQQ